MDSIIDIVVAYSERKYQYIVLKQDLAWDTTEICSLEITEEDASMRAYNENDGQRHRMYHFYYRQIIDEIYVESGSEEIKSRRVMKDIPLNEQITT